MESVRILHDSAQKVSSPTEAAIHVRRHCISAAELIFCHSYRRLLSNIFHFPRYCLYQRAPVPSAVVARHRSTRFYKSLAVVSLYFSFENHRTQQIAL